MPVFAAAVGADTRLVHGDTLISTKDINAL
jgi:hypothetical protein